MYNLKNILLNCLCLVSLFSCNHKPEKPEIKENANFCVGTYQGTVPCASCPGIKTTITLNADDTYYRNEEYLGEESNSFLDTGKYDVNCIDSVITLFDKSQKRDQSYKWTGSELRHLDINGNEIFGSLRDNYILKKNIKK
jgi:uncharacterized lipoprotein NlpE involved in copper resistance